MRRLGILASLVLVAGCSSPEERPRAAGLITDPVPLSDAENQQRMTDIITVTTPDPQLSYPATAASRPDDRLLAWVERVDQLIAAGEYDRARQMLEHIQADLRASAAHDQQVIDAELLRTQRTAAAEGTHGR